VRSERVADIRREGGAWVLNGRLAAGMLVGAGGHFCPVARFLNGPPPASAVVVAREIEYRLEGEARRRCPVLPEQPELYFCPDLQGYGWVFRKGAWLNVGLGRRDPQALPRHLEAFLGFLVKEGRIGPPPEAGWCGHAYLVRETPLAGEGGRREALPRELGREDALLVGDAAGCAFPASGEGILPAIVSGRLAAEAILTADGPSRVARYAESLTARLGPPGRARAAPGPFTAAAGAVLLGAPWFVRHVVLDRWFLHRRNAAADARTAAPPPA
jgi:flavin-dependent dehydrogenase